MSQQQTAAARAVLDSSVRVPSHVVFRTFALETVVVNLERGMYHGVNPVGGRMLETLERTPRVREAAAKLAAEFDRPPGEIEADLCAFCSHLIERGLLELVP